jgi:hypothetical protein
MGTIADTGSASAFADGGSDAFLRTHDWPVPN